MDLIGSEIPDTPLAIGSPSLHTMGASLVRYVQTRVHEYVDDLSYARIRVFGSYDRSLAASKKEKRDKRENWQRPTAKLNKGTLEIHCYPGKAYTFHYGSLIATHLKLTGRDPSIVSISLPDFKACAEEISRGGFSYLKPTKSLVVASGNDELAEPDAAWQDHQAFQSRVEGESRNAITWLAVKHSFWGDIAYHLGYFLASLGFEQIVFVGKLGSLVPEHQPNLILATGDSSSVAGMKVEWANLFDSDEDGMLEQGRHVTLASVLQETVEWRDAQESQYDFVDPEIGYFASGVIEAGAAFSYAHIVSDNLSRTYSHDLSNERESLVVKRRTVAYQKLGKTLRTRLAD